MTDQPFASLMGRVDDKRRAKLAREMTHYPSTHKDPFHGLTENFAMGVYEAPGMLMEPFDFVVEHTMGSILDRLSPTDTTSMAAADELMGLAEVEQAFNELGPYDAPESLQALARFSGQMIDPLAIGGAGLDIARMSKRYGPQVLREIADTITHGSVIKSQIGAAGPSRKTAAEVYYHGTPGDWMGEGGDFRITEDGLMIPGVSLSPSKKTARHYAGEGGRIGEFNIDGPIHPDYSKAFDEAEALGMDVQDYLTQNYAGVYVEDFDEVRVFDPSAIKPLSRNGEGVTAPAPRRQSVRVKPLSDYFGRGTTTGGLDDMTGTRPNSGKVDVLINPTEAELKRHAGREIKSYRSFVDENGDLYAWNGEDAIHTQVLDSLGIDRATLRNEMSDTTLPPDLLHQRLREWGIETNATPKAAGEKDWYHGTPNIIDDWFVNKYQPGEGFAAGYGQEMPAHPTNTWGTWLTENPGSADEYATEYMFDDAFGVSAPTVYPVRARVKKTYEMPWEEFKRFEDREGAADYMVDTFEMGDRELEEFLAERGNEGLEFMDHLKSQGYDSIAITTPDGLREMVVFDPANIRSKFDISDDIRDMGDLGAFSKQRGAIGVRQIGDFDPRFDPRVNEQERLRNLSVSTSMADDPAASISIQDLEGSPFITSMSDRTAGGGDLLGIGDVDLNLPVELLGGQDYMFHNPGQVWASGKNPVNAIHGLAGDIKRTTGKDPLLLPWRMAPTGGDFAHMTGETMLSYADTAMNKKNKAKANTAIKKLIAGWKGVGEAGSLEQYKAAPDAVRKQIKNILDTRFRNEGGLSIGAARLSVADPKQLTAPDGGLMNIGRIESGRPVIEGSGHPSYPYGVPGEGVGRLKEDIQVYQLLPDLANIRGTDPLNPKATDLRALQMKPYAGLISEHLLRLLEE